MSMPPATRSRRSSDRAAPGSRARRTECRPRPRAARAGCRSAGSASGTPTACCSSVAVDSTGPTTSGITSPALRTTTVSPGRTSLTATWSWLCSVAMPTVEPPTKTGSSTANGVARPVRPTDTMMSRSSGGALLGRELVGDRPARSPRGDAEALALCDVVDLDHHAVDLVVEVVAMFLPVQAVGGDLVDRRRRCARGR